MKTIICIEYYFNRWLIEIRTLTGDFIGIIGVVKTLKEAREIKQRFLRLKSGVVGD